MEYLLSKRFEKEFSKLPSGVKRKVIAALERFVQDHEHPSLRAHALAGTWRDHWSIDVTGDYRAVYTHVTEDVVRFVAIGTHAQLYG